MAAVKAVFVGINYTNGIGGQDLQGLPAVYAKKMMAALTMPMVGLYEHNQCLLFSDRKFTDLPAGMMVGEPSKGNVRKALNEMVHNAKKGDVLLFYFCGHGVNDVYNKRGALKTLNSKLSDSDVIYSDELEKIFESLDSSINVTFLIHACFSGAMFSHNPKGMKGIALASVGPDILSVVNKDATSTDFTTSIRDDVIKNLRKGEIKPTDDNWPTYQQVYDRVKTTVVSGEMPDKKKTSFKGHAEMYHASNMDPSKMKFLSNTVI